MAQKTDKSMRIVFTAWWIIAGLVAVVFATNPPEKAESDSAGKAKETVVAQTPAANTTNEPKTQPASVPPVLPVAPVPPVPPVAPAVTPTPGPTAPPANTVPNPADGPIIITGKRVLIISIDGLRPDLLLLAETPNLRGLIKGGSYSMWAQTIPAGVTLPSHTSMLTGVSTEKHGVYWNGDYPPRRVRNERSNFPTIFSLAKDRGYTTALVAGKYKFNTLAEPNFVDYIWLPDPPKRVPAFYAPVRALGSDGTTSGEAQKNTDMSVAEQAAAIIRHAKPQVMFVHFGMVDGVGHRYGWGTPIHLETIGLADQAVGKVLDALREKKVFDNTLIIVSADHGGMGRIHNGKDPRGLHIPWIVHGPGVRKGYDLNTNDKAAVNTMDTFATACYHLGITFKPDDEVEGKPVMDIFGTGVMMTDAPKTDATTSSK